MPPTTPSIAARAIFSRVKFWWVIPWKLALAFGRFGVRSPSKCGSKRNPPAPLGAASANSLKVSSDTPKVSAIVAKTFAAFNVQASGRKFPVASAKPAISPLGSWVDIEETAKAVPLVPSEITKSPTAAPKPSAAPALSPAPAAMGVPDFVWPPN